MEINQILELSNLDFKAAIIKMPQQAITNSLVTKKEKILSKK